MLHVPAHERRHLSQIPIPSSGLIIEESAEGHLAVLNVRKRRTFSEQISPYDR